MSCVCVCVCLDKYDGQTCSVVFCCVWKQVVAPRRRPRVAKETAWPVSPRGNLFLSADCWKWQRPRSVWRIPEGRQRDTDLVLKHVRANCEMLESPSSMALEMSLDYCCACQLTAWRQMNGKYESSTHATAMTYCRDAPIWSAPIFPLSVLIGVLKTADQMT